MENADHIYSLIMYIHPPHVSLSFSHFRKPIVFFDVSVDGLQVGRIVMELRADVVPKTSGDSGQ